MNCGALLHAALRGSKRRGARLCAALALLAGPGCTVVQLDQEARAFHESTVLVGRVDVPAGWVGPVRVAALRLRGGPEGRGPEVVHATRLHEAGGYELIVPRGEYRVVAFGDADDDGVPGPDEPAGEHAGGRVVAADGTGVVTAIDVDVRHGVRTLSDGPVRAAFAAVPPGRSSTQAGALADLDAPAFSAENGQRGYWTPMTFYKETGGNVWFLEPYDPRRIPVLFVHGAGGSGSDWRYFVERLDRTRFQPWIFQYPSGASVESMSHLLFWKLHNLQLRYPFERLCITAHSMGGLVVRDFLQRHGSLVPQARLFVSISTPWGGEPAAGLGVRHSPAVVPSWRDMQPDGPFMQSLFARPLPSGVEFHLLFGHRGGYSLLRPNNDGAVSLASQLRSPAQAEARSIYGFDEDHTSILSSPGAFAQYRTILAAFDRQGAAGPDAGRLQVSYPVDASAPDARTSPVLLLRPVGPGSGGRTDTISVPLAPNETRRTVGPIPAGVYDASVVAPAFRSRPSIERVRVDASGLAELTVRLTPQGTLANFVADDTASRSASAGSVARAHPTLRIDSVTLRGPGVERTLVPRRSGPDDVVEAYLRDEDDAVGAQFSFVGLPAGDYALTVSARGYRPYTAVHAVAPGRQGPWAPIVLVPE